MYQNVKSSVVAIVLLLCLILISVAEGQLNFSTGWGKRSEKIGGSSGEGGGGQGGESGAECAARAKVALQQLFNLYTLIQIEARKMLHCQKLYE